MEKLVKMSAVVVVAVACWGAGEAGTFVPKEYLFEDISFIDNRYDFLVGPSVDDEFKARKKRLAILGERFGLKDLKTIVEQGGCSAAIRVSHPCDVIHTTFIVVFCFQDNGLKVEEISLSAEFVEKLRRGEDYLDPLSINDIGQHVRREIKVHDYVEKRGVVNLPMALNLYGVGRLESARPARVREPLEDRPIPLPKKAEVISYLASGSPKCSWLVEVSAKKSEGQVLSHSFVVDEPGILADIRYEKILLSLGKSSPLLAARGNLHEGLLKAGLFRSGPSVSRQEEKQKEKVSGNTGITHDAGYLWIGIAAVISLVGGFGMGRWLLLRKKSGG